jgi:hypothetical protein
MEMHLREEGPLKTWQRFGGVISSPGQTLADITAHPSWVKMLLLVSGLGFLFTLVTLPKLKEFAFYTIQQQLEKMPQLAGTEDVMMTTIIAGALFGAFLAPALLCLLTAVFLKLFNLFAGERVRFGSFYAVAVHAYIPLLIATAITSAMILFTPATNYSEVSTSLYLLFPPGSTGFWPALARYADPFYLWTVYLTALGAACATRSSLRPWIIYLLTLFAAAAVVFAFLGRTAGM